MGTQHVARAIAEIAYGKTKNENPVFVPGRGERFWFLSSITRGLQGDRFGPMSATALSYTPPLAAFRTEEAARSWADAIHVMMELRALPGVVPFKKGNWTIGCFNGNIQAVFTSHDGIQLSTLAPFYSSEQAAEAAIQLIGAGRILAAARTFAWEV